MLEFTKFENKWFIREDFVGIHINIFVKLSFWYQSQLYCILLINLNI